MELFFGGDGSTISLMKDYETCFADPSLNRESPVFKLPSVCAIDPEEVKEDGSNTGVLRAGDYYSLTPFHEPPLADLDPTEDDKPAMEV